MRKLYLGLGCIMLILGGAFFLKDILSERWIEIPAIFMGTGFSLIALATFQWLFKDRLPGTMLFLGTMSIFLPVVLAWKTTFSGWWIILGCSVGIVFIVGSIRNRSPVTRANAED